MANLKRIYELFEDELARREVKVRILSLDFKAAEWGGRGTVQPQSGSRKENRNWEPWPLRFKSFENGTVIFSDYEGLRNLKAQWPEEAFPERSKDEIIKFNCLFWLLGEGERDNTLILRWLPCGGGTVFSEDLDIALPDDLTDYTGKTDEWLNGNFRDRYVFSHRDRSFIFLETYLSNQSGNLRLYGRSSRAEIEIKEGKWRIVREIKNKPFPRKLEIFTDLKIAVHPGVYFKEKAEVREALQAISADRRSGRDILSLWEKYAKLEEDRTLRLKSLFGKINFKILPSSDNSKVARVLFVDANQAKNLDDYRDEFLKSSLECGGDRYKIKKLAGMTCEIEDEDDILREKGMGFFEISTQGDEVVQKRRKRALETFNKNANRLLINTLLAMEGQAERMSKASRKGVEGKIPKRTRDFLKDRFGISSLTRSQEEAVLMALNTPNLAVIQGPPGTGKSTVVAAICHGLLELETMAGESPDRVILISSYQNETLEYTASKIEAWGLPTQKVDSKSKGQEEQFINKRKEHLQGRLAEVAESEEEIIFDLRKKLADLLERLKTENQARPVREEVDSLLKTYPQYFEEERAAAWRDLFAERAPAGIKKAEKAILGLRTEEVSYRDDGYGCVRALLTALPPGVLTEEEKTLLKTAPTNRNGDGPSAEFLRKLRDLKERLKDKILEREEIILEGTNPALENWLEETLEAFRLKIDTCFEKTDLYRRAVYYDLLDDLEGNPEYIREALAGYSQSLAATNQMAGSGKLASILGYDQPTVKNVILEEAARSNPLDLLIPMTKARERLILVGDQNQLPHLLEDDLAEEAALLSPAENAREKLKESLFGIIFNNLEKVEPVRRIILNEQFRMHPFIGDFISQTYYDGQLKSGADLAAKKKHDLSLPWAKDKVAVFCEVAGLEEPKKSKSRRAEVRRIFELLGELQEDPAIRDKTVGIITFYARQMDLLIDEARKQKYLDNDQDDNRTLSEGGKLRLSIGTVDSLQGQEFDIVFLSTVRANDLPRTEANAKRIFGFLGLPNRLNVAFSRAQRLLVVVGQGRMYEDELAQKYVPGLHKFYNQLSTDKNHGGRI